jgi:hypothetical protein
MMNSEKDLTPYLSQPGKNNIIYSNGDTDAGYALVLARGLDIKTVT